MKKSYKTYFSVGLLLLALCFGCDKNPKQATSPAPEVQPKSSDTKFTQYYVKGEQLYLNNCSNCHQKNGLGLGRLYPPLNGSDYLANHPEEVLCIMRHGKTGEIIVNGKSFNKEMPGIPTLTDLEIAEIATYIYNSWGSERGLIDVKSVSLTLNKCNTHQ